jgi:hypothetical protein
MGGRSLKQINSWRKFSIAGLLLRFRDFLKGDFWGFLVVLYPTLLQLLLLRFPCVGGCRIEPKTVATTALAVRRSNHSARFDTQRLDLIPLG